jgi:hypothetical protein
MARFIAYSPTPSIWGGSEGTICTMVSVVIAWSDVMSSRSLAQSVYPSCVCTKLRTWSLKRYYCNSTLPAFSYTTPTVPHFATACQLAALSPPSAWELSTGLNLGQLDPARSRFVGIAGHPTPGCRRRTYIWRLKALTSMTFARLLTSVGSFLAMNLYAKPRSLLINLTHGRTWCIVRNWFHNP